MSPGEKTILLCTVVLVVIAGLFPPWINIRGDEGALISHPVGYGFLLDPPRTRLSGGIALDLPRLVIEWIMLAAMGGAGLMLPAKAKGD